MQTRIIHRTGRLLILVCALGILAQPSLAGIVVYEEEDGPKKVEIGGRIQLQYLNANPSEGDSEDEIFFRRLRPYIMGTVTENWMGKIQFDFGKSLDQNEVAVKDAYMQYTGWENLTLTIGNAKPFFSREFLTSSKRQQTVERGFVGDHNFGTPDRALGFKLAGQNDSKRMTWGVSAGAQHHDPDVRRLDFDTPVNNASDWNEGLLVSARADIHPKGFMKFDQSDFNSDKLLYSLSVAAFSWTNDDDNNTYTDDDGGSLNDKKADLDSANGFELSAGLRGFGWSFDIEYDLVNADTVVADFTGGMYVGGTTDNDRFQIEGGYMLPSNNIEIVAKYQWLDADGYEDMWTATEIGANYYWNKHKTKVQFTYRMGENAFGVGGDDIDSFFMQWQFVF